MFHKDFYPTPAHVVRKMIAPLELRAAYVLEPSAGKGDILDVVAQKYSDAHLYAIEPIGDLRAILRDKGYSLLADDFLTYTPRLHFTHILMNPPFSQAEDHLLHAWNILYEGQIVCILPNTILEGKTEKERTICQLIADHGHGHEPERLGPAFAHAENPTNVNVVIVRLCKQADGEKLDWEVHNDRDLPDFDVAENRELAPGGFVTSLLASYNASLAHYEAYNRARQDVLRYAGPFLSSYGLDPMQEADKETEPQKRYNTFLSLMTEEAWSKILDHPKFQAVLTERARNMMREFRSRQRRVDFNEHNLRAMFDELVSKQDELLMGAVLDAFDTMTKFHEANRIYYEGWKSNKAWKVNRRVVLPYYVEFSYGSLRLQYQNTESLNDIDRALSVVAGVPYTSTQTVKAALELAFHNREVGGVTDSTFFEIKFYKKGTIHLYFLDEALWKKFNLMAARGRNWLPPGQ